MRQPLLIEVFGEPEAGKSETALSAADFGFNVFLIDTTDKGESQANAIKFYGDKFEEHYARVSDLDGVRKKVDYALSNGYNVISIDTSADLQGMAVKEWCKREGRKKPLSFEYGDVRDIVDDAVVRKVVPPPEEHLPYKSHLIFTAQMKDEYKGVKKEDGTPKTDERGNPVSYKTGRRERDGFERMRHEADIRLYLEIVDKTDEKGNVVGQERRARVTKNRFCSRAGKGWIPILVGDENINFGAIIKLATIPKELGGLGIKEEWLR